MPQSFRCFISAILALISWSFPAHSGFNFTLGGNTGVFLVPGEVSGFIDGGVSSYSRYIWAESSVDQYGYIQKTYKYRHPFPEKTLPNVGMNFGVEYLFQSRIGVFIDGSRSFSILDKAISQNAADTLAGDDYSVIPHDFRIRRTVSNDRLYMKSFQLGLGLSYTMPCKKGSRIIIAGSIGRASYSQYFRIETESISIDYFQNDGHRVFTETNDQGSFEVFGIRYEATCFKPSVAMEWDLRPPLSLRVGLACPVALIEKGVHYTGNSSYYGYSNVYYPSKRFWTGNMVLSAGIVLNFSKGGVK